MAENAKSSIFAIVEETTTDVLKKPTGASNFVPLRQGFGQTAAFETLESDELLNSLGASEPATGKEVPTGTHPMYIKHSEVEGQEPETGLLFESLLGGKTVNATEYSTTTGSSAGTSSARAQLTMASDEEDNFEVGQAVLIKDGANGYSIRNIYNIDSANDELDLNFNLASAPGSGVGLGKAVLYKPASSGHPTFSAWCYWGNGAAIQALSGCLATSLSMTFEAGQFAVSELGYSGVTSYYNPFVLTSSNKYIDFTDDSGTVAATLTEGSYKTPVALATEIATKMTAASVGSGDNTISCSYDSTTGKFTISTDGSTLSLLWNSGSNTANSVGTTIGFVVAADDTGATTYTSDNAISLAAEYTASYDDAQNIVCKNAELVIGDYSDYLCIGASTLEFTIDSPTADADSICPESGVEEKIKDSRSVSMSTTVILDQYESARFDALVNNTTVGVMANFGQKDSSGNWVPGKCVNIYMPNCKITSHNLGGELFLTIEMALNAFVTSQREDIYVNFI